MHIQPSAWDEVFQQFTWNINGTTLTLIGETYTATATLQFNHNYLILLSNVNVYPDGGYAFTIQNTLEGYWMRTNH